MKDVRGQLPLHRAAAVGSVPILKALLEEGKSPVNATDGDGFTALHHAVSEGHGDAAILLLKSGAEADKRDNDGRLAVDLVPDDKVSILFPALVVVFKWDKGPCGANTLVRSSNTFSRRQRETESNYLDKFDQ